MFLRPLLCASLLVCVATTACKGKDAGKSEPKASPANPEKVANKVAGEEVPESATPVEPDLALIDATLEKLGDATVAHAATNGLPQAASELAIACGNDKAFGTVLTQMGFAGEPLKPGKGFLYQDVCIGWRPYITPPTEMYWMISAGAPAEGQEVMPVRRCLQVIKEDDGFKKATIIDGPCLTMHRLDPEFNKELGEQPAQGLGDDE